MTIQNLLGKAFSAIIAKRIQLFILTPPQQWRNSQPFSKRFCFSQTKWYSSRDPLILHSPHFSLLHLLASIPSLQPFDPSHTDPAHIPDLNSARSPIIGVTLSSLMNLSEHLVSRHLKTEENQNILNKVLHCMYLLIKSVANLIFYFCVKPFRNQLQISK